MIIYNNHKLRFLILRNYFLESLLKLITRFKVKATFNK